MALLPKAVPMRWASGPLEIALRSKTDGFTPQHKQTLERFHDPASLEILKDSPIDCLILSWAAGLTEDAIRRLLENELAQLKDGVIRRRT